MLRRELYLWRFAKNLYHGWISTMTSSNKISWKLPPPRNEELVAPLPGRSSRKSRLFESPQPSRWKSPNEILGNFGHNLYSNYWQANKIFRRLGGKKLVLLDPSKTKIVSCSAEGWEGSRLRWNPTWNAQSLESSSLAESCVSGGMVSRAAEPFSKWGAQVHIEKKLQQILSFELATVTSQALKYDVIAYTPHEGLNYTILDKTTPLWKRIGEPSEIQIGCYRGDPGH